MKRSWIGLGLLAVLLCAGILVTWAMGAIHEPIAEDLDRAAECAMQGDWEAAERYADTAEKQWEKWNHFRACFADHAPVEEIDSGFAELQVYRTTREEIIFAAACKRLSRQVAAVGEAHGLLWWNIL